MRIPARGGLAHARGLLRRVASTPRAPEGTRGDLAAAIEQLRRPPRRRGLAVVISDFLGEPEWERALRALSARHELLAVEVLDPRELELPDVGTVVLADPETGRQREVTITPLAARREFAAAAAEHRDRVAATLRRCGAAHLTLRTDSDWIADVVRFVLARKRAWSGGAVDVRRTRGGCCCSSSWRRWSAGYVLLLRRRRRDTVRVHQPGAARPGRPEAAGLVPAPAGGGADRRAGRAHDRAGRPAGRGAGAAQPGHGRAGDRRVAVDAGHGRRAEPARRGAGGGEGVRRPAHPRHQPGAGVVRRHGGGAGVADGRPRAGEARGRRAEAVRVHRHR